MSILLLCALLGAAYAAARLCRGCKGRAERRRVQEAAPCVRRCMDVAQDLSHFLPGHGRSVFFHYDYDQDCVLADIFVLRGGYLKAIYPADRFRGLSPEAAEGARRDERRRCFGDYEPKSRVCMRALEEGRVEWESLLYTAALGGQRSGGVMRYLLEAAQAWFPDAVENVKRCSTGDVTFWLRFRRGGPGVNAT